MKRLVLDMDRSVSPTYGDQEGTAYNGHFECTGYHPMFLLNQHGNLERALLRNGNVHSADDWISVLEPVVARYRKETFPKFFRRRRIKTLRRRQILQGVHDRLAKPDVASELSFRDGRARR